MSVVKIEIVSHFGISKTTGDSCFKREQIILIFYTETKVSLVSSSFKYQWTTGDVELEVEK